MGNPTVTPFAEVFRDGGFLVNPSNTGHTSFEQGTLASGAKVFAGTALGLVTSGLAAAAAALGTNTGNGTFGAITPQVAPVTMIGAYAVLFTAATAFTVTAPDGTTAPGTTGVAFSALGIGFTITVGGTPFVANDSFSITTTATVGTPGISSAAGTNTGNGTLGSLTAQGYAAKPGPHVLEMLSATTFVLYDPAGLTVGRGSTGVAFKSGGLAFTLTAGATPFAAGDSFVLTVSTGSGKYKQWTPGAADGSGVVAGLMFATKDATLADKQITVVARQAEVNTSELVWPSGASASVIAAGLAGLRALAILPR